MSILKTTDTTPIISNADASLIDIGDGITRLELHSKLNIIGDEMLEMFDAALDEVETNYAGMIIATEAKHFSVGLNLILLLERAKNQNWDAISGTLRKLQTVCTRLRTASKPVIAATAGMALGVAVNSLSVRMPSKLSLKVRSVSLNSASDLFRLAVALRRWHFDV